jgi:hypothetical protein
MGPAVHQQVTQHNSYIHYREKDDLTAPEHHDFVYWVEGCALADPDTLLTWHCSLFEADFEALESGSILH